MNKDLKDHLSRRLGNESDRQSGGKPRSGPVLPTAASQCVEAGQDNADLSSTTLVSLIRERLGQHPHFRGRNSLLQIEETDGAIVLSGRLPSYYLKQLLQEVIKTFPDVTHIDNHVDVTFP